jgi:hypothetical protein
MKGCSNPYRRYFSLAKSSRGRLLCRSVTRGALAPPYKSTYQYVSPPFDPEPVPNLDIDLPPYDIKGSNAVDVVIAGAGPAGIATAARIASQGRTVVVVDPNPLQHWPNNYGVWSDEFIAMGLQDCFEREWSKASVWLDDYDER